MALAITALLTAAVELGGRHHAARSLGGRILGAVIGALLLALVLRALIFVLEPAWRRTGSRGRAPMPSTGLSGAVPAGEIDGLAGKRPWGAAYSFAWLVLVWVALAAIGFALQETHVVHLPLGAGTLIVEGLFLLALIPLNRRCGARAADIGLRPTNGPRAVGLAIGGSIAVALLGGIYLAAVRPRRATGTLEGLGHHPAGIVVLACFASIVAAPFAEEIFFRGLLYGGLRNRLPVVPAALIVAVVFGLGHTQYPLLVRPEMAIFGFVACLLYERTRSLLPSMAMHSFHNAIAITIALHAGAGPVLCAYGALALLACAPALRREIRSGRGGAPAANARA